MEILSSGRVFAGYLKRMFSYTWKCICILVTNHYHILGRLELTTLAYIVHVDCLLQDGLLRVLLDGGPTHGFAGCVEGSVSALHEVLTYGVSFRVLILNGSFTIFVFLNLKCE